MRGKCYPINPVKHLAVLLLSAVAAALAISSLPQSGEAAEEIDREPLPIVSETEQAAQSREDIESEIIIVTEQALEEGASRSAQSVSGEVANAVEEVGGRLEDDTGGEIKTARFDELGGDRQALEEKAERISELPGVEYAEPNGFVEMHYSPNDTYFSRPRGIANQGNLRLTGFPAAWNGSRGNGVAVGIADSGLVQGYTEIFPNKVAAQTDMLNGDRIANDTHGHGTQVASIATAKTNNDFGMAGAGFNAEVAMCKFSFYDSETGVVGGSAAHFARCMNWLQKQSSVKVVNLSLGTGTTNYRVIADEVSQTQQQYNKLVVASVGNEGRRFANVYPAGLPGVIGVGSNDGNTGKSSFSNSGPFVDIVAPGNGIVSVVGNGEKPILGTGTSYSAPTVSGCAALLFAKDLKLGQVRTQLLDGAVDMGSRGRDDATGHGYLHCGRALAN